MAGLLLVAPINGSHMLVIIGWPEDDVAVLLPGMIQLRPTCTMQPSVTDW